MNVQSKNKEQKNILGGFMEDALLEYLISFLLKSIDRLDTKEAVQERAPSLTTVGAKAALSQDLLASFLSEVRAALPKERWDYYNTEFHKLSPEPARAEPERAEPARAEPAQAEPAQAEPARAEPARAEPAQAEPAQAEPARAEPVEARPAEAKPMESYLVEAQKNYPHVYAAAVKEGIAMDDIFNNATVDDTQLKILEDTYVKADALDKRLSVEKDPDVYDLLTAKRNRAVAAKDPTVEDLTNRDLVSDLKTFINDYVTARAADGDNPNFWVDHVNAGTNDLKSFDQYGSAVELQNRLGDLKENFDAFNRAETERDASDAVKGDGLMTFIQRCSERNEVQGWLTEMPQMTKDLIYGVTVHHNQNDSIATRAMEGASYVADTVAEGASSFVGGLKSLFSSHKQEEPQQANNTAVLAASEKNRGR